MKKRKNVTHRPESFTDRSLKALVNDPTNYHRNIADPKCRGLNIRPRKNGEAAWVARRQSGGKNREKVLGDYPRLTIAEARTKASVWLGKNSVSATTFGYAVGDWIAAQKTMYPQWERALNVHLKPLHSRRLDDLEIVSFTSIVQQIAKDHKPEALLVLQKARAVTRYAAAMGWIDRDILGPVKPGEVVKYRQPEYEAVDDDKLIRKAFADDSWAGRALQASLLTGARMQELVGYRAEQLSGRIWKRPASIMKAGKAHDLPLSGMAFELFDQCFPLDITYSGIYGYTKRNYPGFSPHDFRRTAGTRLGQLGFADSLINYILAHQQGRLTRVYVRGQPIEQMRDALEKLAAHYKAVIAAGSQ
jgi:integrase